MSEDTRAPKPGFVQVTCPCGTVFEVRASRLSQGRGKYCSQACKYKYRKLSSRKGFKYNCVKENPTQFKPGQAPWNKGVAVKGEISYKELHRWVARHKTKTGICTQCDAEGETFWANISREYRRDLDDFQEMCRKCHRRFDGGENWGKATAKFGWAAVQKGLAY